MKEEGKGVGWGWKVEGREFVLCPREKKEKSAPMSSTINNLHLGPLTFGLYTHATCFIYIEKQASNINFIIKSEDE